MWEGETPDDFEPIVGIGKVFEQRLYDAGIRSYRRLASATVEELAAYAGAKYAIGVGNGTDALWLAFMALGLGEGDELTTHANTFFATAEAMCIAGCTAVLVDCDPQTKCIDPAAIGKAISKRT